MWYKNAYFYSLQSLGLTSEELNEQLSNKPFIECLPTQRESLGFVPVIHGTDSLVHSANSYTLMTMARQERLLPAKVVAHHLAEAIETIQDAEDRKVSGKEKRDIKEQIEFDLLPKSHKLTTRFDAYMNDKYLVVNTASSKVAETFCDLLRKALGSLPVELPEEVPAPIMTEWVLTGSLPEAFELGDEAEMVDANDSKAVFRKHELSADEVTQNIINGKIVNKLSLVWRDKISFTIDADMVISKVKFLDILKEQLDAEDPQSHAEQLDVEFVLMTGEFDAMWSDLVEVFA